MIGYAGHVLSGRLLRTLALLSPFALALTLTGCLASTSQTPKTPDGLTCAQRLQGGMWKFTGFRPDQPLPPNAASALERLHGSLRVGYDGQQALTTGPGLYHLQPYRVYDDDGLQCRIEAPDDTGRVSSSFVRFSDANHLEVLDQRSQVPGRSTMERVPVGQ